MKKNKIIPTYSISLILAHIFITFIFFELTTRIEAIALIFIFLFIKLIHDFVYKQLFYPISIIINISLVMTPFYYKFSATTFLVFGLISAIILFAYTGIMGGILYEKYVGSTVELKFFSFFMKILIWGITISFSVSLMIFSIQTWIETFLPKHAIITFLIKKEILHFFNVIAFHLVCAYISVYVLINLYNKLINNSQVLLLILSLIVCIALPDTLYSLFYYIIIKQFDSISTASSYNTSDLLHSFYFTFSLHHAMPIVDQSLYSSNALKLLNITPALKFVQIGHIWITKIYDIIALGVVIDFLRSRHFVIPSIR